MKLRFPVTYFLNKCGNSIDETVQVLAQYITTSFYHVLIILYTHASKQWAGIYVLKAQLFTNSCNENVKPVLTHKLRDSVAFIYGMSLLQYFIKRMQLKSIRILFL